MSFEEKIMSKVKCLKIFSCQMKANIVFGYFLLDAESFEDWGIPLGYSPILAGEHSVM